MKLSPQDRATLEVAVRLLENPGLAARLANIAGVPVEKLFEALPERLSSDIQNAVRLALRKALEVAVYRIDTVPRRETPDALFKVMTACTGAAGGSLGLPALAVELPVTTTIMLRSIAEIARSEGEDLGDPEAKLACLEVFALGGRSSRDDAVETGYYGVRAMLAKAVSEAAKYIAERGLAEEGAPVLVRLLAAIAARFGVVVSEKVAAGAVPVIGAVGGATVNLLFMNHFQNIAHGHFMLRRLERNYGVEIVRTEYECFRDSLRERQEASDA